MAIAKQVVFRAGLGGLTCHGLEYVSPWAPSPLVRRGLHLDATWAGSDNLSVLDQRQRNAVCRLLPCRRRAAPWASDPSGEGLRALSVLGGPRHSPPRRCSRYCGIGERRAREAALFAACAVAAFYIHFSRDFWSPVPRRSGGVGAAGSIGAFCLGRWAADFPERRRFGSHLAQDGQVRSRPGRHTASTMSSPTAR